MSRTRLATTASAAGSAFALAALLAACAAPSPAGGDADQGDAPAATGDFCAEFEANGGNGATIGPLQTWAPKEDLLPDVQSRLDAMGDIVPPEDIAAEWETMKTYYTEVLAAAQDLPAGGVIADTTLIQAPEGYEAVTDYYFATC